MALLPLEEKIKAIVEAEQVVTDDLIKSTLAVLYKKDRTFLGLFADFLNELNLDDAEEEEEEFDGEEEVERKTIKHTPQSAAKIYYKTIKSVSRQKFLKRSISTKSHAYQVMRWLDDRMPSTDKLLEIGHQVALQNGLRRFVGAHRRFVTDIASSYKSFRKDGFSEKKFYDIPLEQVKHITDMELDAVILLTLKNTRLLLKQNYVNKNIDNSIFNYLTLRAGVFRNQIMVDEATDFSIIQLACMRSLTSVDIDSFFACGDFNQRIVSSGVSSEEQLSWIITTNQVQKITAIYRQSQKLNDFAHDLLKHTDGDISSLGQIPEESNHQGVDPVISEHLDKVDDIAIWLSQRIIEINDRVNLGTENSERIVPTIAVLVKDEQSVEPLANALNLCLEELSLTAEACLGGKSLGESTGVRVFNVEYIKGLEFEAVFFVSIDELALNLPELFDKYLYVGTTRAATYLGLTAVNKLPDKIEALRNRFIQHW
jgi:hypothetical protein